MARITKKQLQAEIDELRNQLIIVCNAPDSKAASQIKLKIKVAYKIESAIWAGNSSTVPKDFKGYIDQIVNS